MPSSYVPPEWPWDCLGYSPIVNAEGRVIGCEIVSWMTVEEIKKKYPDAVIPERRKA